MNDIMRFMNFMKISVIMNYNAKLQKNIHIHYFPHNKFMNQQLFR